MEQGIINGENEGRREEIVTERARMIGEQFCNDRKNARYTIRDLAALLEISPTHLNRIEKGYRLLDSIGTLIRFCELCQVPINKYLLLYGMKYTEDSTPVRKAFPAIRTTDQEKAVIDFEEIITSGNLSTDDLRQIRDIVTAYADFCRKR